MVDREVSAVREPRSVEGYMGRTWIEKIHWERHNAPQWIRLILETLRDLSLGHAPQLEERELDSIVRVILDHNIDAESFLKIQVHEYEKIFGITCMCLQVDLFAITHQPLPAQPPSIAIDPRHRTAVQGSTPIKMSLRAKKMMALTHLPC